MEVGHCVISLLANAAHALLGSCPRARRRQNGFPTLLGVASELLEDVSQCFAFGPADGV
jgi:hypothetical protein